MRSRRSWWRFALRAVPTVLLLAVTATLAAGLQVREVRVTGTHRFPSRAVEAILRGALGTPTVAARAAELRDMVRALPWVEDATVRVSLDGVVSCVVVERAPAAVAVDGGVGRLLDREGRVLGPADASARMLELDGFAAYPEERATVLASAGELQRCWEGSLERIERLAPHDVALRFAGIPFPILVDPSHPEGLTAARKVLAAWIAAPNPMPLRLDARVPGRVAVLPAPLPEEQS